MKRLLVVGGVHGDELLGIEVVRKVGGLAANPRAIKQKVRFTETDLNRSFCVPIPISYEEVLAKKIAEKINTDRYDCIIDIHTTKADNSTCAIVTTQPTRFHCGLVHHFGLSRLVVMRPSHALISLCPMISLSVEIATNDTRFFSVGYLMQKLQQLKHGKNTIRGDSNTVDQYYYEHRVTKKTVQRLHMPLYTFNNFVPLTSEQKHTLGLPIAIDYCPLFTKGKTIEDGSFTLLRRISGGKGRLAQASVG